MVDGDVVKISIHAPRMGSDLSARRIRATSIISIHAPRMGSDFELLVLILFYLHFNPRSPHGERRPLSRPKTYKHNFNPRSPHGERLNSCVLCRSVFSFQFTLPAWGATFTCVMVVPSVPEFQSTLPAWGATKLSIVGTMGVDISIHAPRMGSD